MTNLKLMYNPYRLQTKLVYTDGAGQAHEIGAGDTLAFILDAPLHVWVEPGDTWRGFFPELKRAFNDDDFVIGFYGTREDFNILEQARVQYAQGMQVKLDFADDKNKSTLSHKLQQVRALYNVQKGNSIKGLNGAEIEQIFSNALNMDVESPTAPMMIQQFHDDLLRYLGEEKVVERQQKKAAQAQEAVETAEQALAEKSKALEEAEQISRELKNQGNITLDKEKLKAEIHLPTENFPGIIKWEGELNGVYGQHDMVAESDVERFTKTISREWQEVYNQSLRSYAEVINTEVVKKCNNHLKRVEDCLQKLPIEKVRELVNFEFVEINTAGSAEIAEELRRVGLTTADNSGGVELKSDEHSSEEKVGFWDLLLGTTVFIGMAPFLAIASLFQKKQEELIPVVEIESKLAESLMEQWTATVGQAKKDALSIYSTVKNITDQVNKEVAAYVKKKQQEQTEAARAVDTAEKEYKKAVKGREVIEKFIADTENILEIEE